FKPNREPFNYYAFDLYCEMGPDDQVIEFIFLHAEKSLSFAHSTYQKPHIYISRGETLTSLSNPKQLQYLSGRLMANAERMERPSANDDVRNEKQRMLDAKRLVQNEVSSREIQRTKNIPADIQTEFEVLDELSRSFSLCVTALGS